MLDRVEGCQGVVLANEEFVEQRQCDRAEQGPWMCAARQPIPRGILRTGTTSVCGFEAQPSRPRRAPANEHLDNAPRGQGRGAALHLGVQVGLARRPRRRWTTPCRVAGLDPPQRQVPTPQSPVDLSAAPTAGPPQGGQIERLRLLRLPHTARGRRRKELHRSAQEGLHFGQGDASSPAACRTTGSPRSSPLPVARLPLATTALQGRC